MEAKRAVVLVVFVVGILTGKSSAASFQDCYPRCFVPCMIDASHTLYFCTTKCVKDCVVQNDLRQDTDSLGFCKFGCAFSMCSTNTIPDREKVDSCVGSCSNKCTETYASP